MQFRNMRNIQNEETLLSKLTRYSCTLIEQYIRTYCCRFSPVIGQCRGDIREVTYCYYIYMNTVYCRISYPKAYCTVYSDESSKYILYDN